TATCASTGRSPENPATDPVASFTDLESRVLREGKFPGYRRLRLDRVEYLGRDAADWEFTYRLSSGTAHVLDRGLRAADAGRSRSTGRPATAPGGRIRTCCGCSCPPSAPA